jgi:DNA polymerase-3 subunit beta
MKVICDRGALSEAVSLTSAVAVARTPRPQLSCLKLSATKGDGAGELTLSATDAEISLRLATAKVDVQDPGEALVPADKLKQIVSAEEREATLTIETDGDVCTITGEDARFTLHGYPPEEFPAIPTLEDAKKASPLTTFTHKAGPFSMMIARTTFATARENSRYAINGVLIKRVGKNLELVATDGRRLALSRAVVSGDKSEKAASAIVPTKALNLLQRLLTDDEEPVTVVITESQALFAVGGEDDPRAVLASNLIEGTFPPYEDVIPKDQDKKVVFDRDLLASAVRRAALLTNEESRGVRMSFHSKDKNVQLSSRAPEMGEAQINIPMNSYSGEDLEIGFNPTFLTDALRVMPEADVIIELKGSLQPGLVKPGSGNDFLYVVMPVSLQ